MDSAREHKLAFNEAISFIVPCDGRSSPRTPRRNNAAGSRISTAYHGSLRPFS